MTRVRILLSKVFITTVREGVLILIYSWSICAHSYNLGRVVFVGTSSAAVKAMASAHQLKDSLLHKMGRVLSGPVKVPAVLFYLFSHYH